MWSVDYLLVDKVSIIGLQLMTAISEALCDAKGNNLLFGNMSIIFAGGFAQLPPVGQRSLGRGCRFSESPTLASSVKYSESFFGI